MLGVMTMKILDYITMASLTGKHVYGSLNKFAADRECEVFVLESSAVIVICDTEKLGFKEKGMSDDKYAMCIIKDYNSGVLKTSESKEELLDDYAKLVTEGLVDSRRSSTSIKEDIQKIIRK